MRKYLRPCLSRCHPVTLWRDGCGAVLIEAALVLPILVIFMVGIVTYGAWFMAAHVVQQAANEGARAALAGMDDAERRTIAGQSVTRSVAAASVVNPALVETSAQTSGGYVTVTVTYDAPKSAMFSSPLIPMPSGPIRRTSIVKLSPL